MNREALKVWFQLVGLLVLIFAFGAAVLWLRRQFGH